MPGETSGKVLAELSVTLGALKFTTGFEVLLMISSGQVILGASSFCTDSVRKSSIPEIDENPLAAFKLSVSFPLENEKHSKMIKR
jgi:hypothetical protein